MTRKKKPTKDHVDQKNEEVQPSVQLSRHLCDWLYRDLRFDSMEIASLLGLGDATFISHVRQGRRSLRLEHLLSLARNLGVPLPILIWRSLKETPRSDAMSKDLYESFDAALRKIYDQSEYGQFERQLARVRLKLNSVQRTPGRHEPNSTGEGGAESSESDDDDGAVETRTFSECR